MRKAKTITDLVGQTPMVRLTALEPAAGAEIWAKLEYGNWPGADRGESRVQSRTVCSGAVR